MGLFTSGNFDFINDWYEPEDMMPDVIDGYSDVFFKTKSGKLLVGVYDGDAFITATLDKYEPSDIKEWKYVIPMSFKKYPEDGAIIAIAHPKFGCLIEAIYMEEYTKEDFLYTDPEYEVAVVFAGTADEEAIPFSEVTEWYDFPKN